jgi:hypothetical protein
MTQFNTAKHTHKVNKIVLTRCKQVLIHGTNIFRYIMKLHLSKKKYTSQRWFKGGSLIFLIKKK